MKKLNKKEKRADYINFATTYTEPNTYAHLLLIKKWGLSYFRLTGAITSMNAGVLCKGANSINAHAVGSIFSRSLADS